MPLPGELLERELWFLPQGFQLGNTVPRELLTKENKNSDKKTEKKIVKRSKHKTNKETSLNIFSTNAASLRAKLKSLKSELIRTNSALFTLQETHMPKKGKVSIEEFEIFETIRTGKIKGGTMIGAHKGLKPVLISELNDPFEVLVIEIELGNKEIRTEFAEQTDQ